MRINPTTKHQNKILQTQQQPHPDPPNRNSKKENKSEKVLLSSLRISLRTISQWVSQTTSRQDRQPQQKP